MTGTPTPPAVSIRSAGAVSGFGVGTGELLRHVRRAAEAPARGLTGFDPAAHVPFRGTRTLCRATQLACVAAAEATASDAWGAIDPERRAVAIGTQWGSIGPLASFNRTIVASGPQQTMPMSFPNVVANVHAGHLGIFFGAAGPNLTVCGPSAGLEALAEAIDLIELGRADAVLTGGTESADAPVGLAGAGEGAALFVLGPARPGEVVVSRDGDRLDLDDATRWDASTGTGRGRRLVPLIGDCRAATGPLTLVAALDDVRRTGRPAIVVSESMTVVLRPG